MANCSQSSLTLFPTRLHSTRVVASDLGAAQAHAKEIPGDRQADGAISAGERLKLLRAFDVETGQELWKQSYYRQAH